MTGTKKQAVALRYQQQQESAPRVIAVGEGLIAERIIEKALENGVPVMEDIEVVGKLVHMPLGSEIPVQLYEAVAKVLVFLYKLEGEKKGIITPPLR